MTQPREEDFTVLTVIWGVMMGGVAMFTAVSYFLVASGTAELAVVDASFLPLVAGVLVSAMFGGLVVRRALGERGRPEASSPEKFAQYRTAVIVSLGIIEGAGIALIMAGLLAGSTGWILAGGGASALMMLSQKPDRGVLGRSRR